MRKTPFFLLCTFLTIGFALIFAIFANNGIKNMDNTVNTVYLELWHVDTFEGGTGSRKAFLESVAKNFNLQSSVKVIVKQQTVLSCEQNFKKGIYPDLISYGNGLNLPYSQLYKLGEGHNSYAKAWCMGGYLLISRADTQIDGVIISTQQNTLSLLAYHLSEVKLPVYAQIQSDNAVYAFYQNGKKALLGTQRDLYRLQNKGVNLQITPLCGYNDLYQYASVVSTDKNRAKYAMSFIDYLLCEKVQLELHKIGMFSEIYTAKGLLQPLSVYEGVSFNYSTQNLITTEQIQNLKKQAENYGQNAESIKNALKRLK